MFCGDYSQPLGVQIFLAPDVGWFASKLARACLRSPGDLRGEHTCSHTFLHCIWAAASEVPAHEGVATRSLGGQWLTPALIDCHTHLVFAGNRAAEFEIRLQGASYEEIARAGGGIMSTVTATRDASAQALAGASSMA